MSIAILDIDGTLVDTNYHHAIAWFRAFCQFDVVLPIWRIHRHIGMGGDQLVAAVAGDQIEEAHGDEIREAEGEQYERLIEQVRPVERARELILALKDHGHTVILASSAKEPEVDHYLDLLDAREIVDGWTSSADVESTKPAPDLVNAALERAGRRDDAVMVGDTPWDVRSAKKADVPTIAVITGGFSREELEEAGTVGVYESVAELEEDLNSTPLG
jgi:HAD superfamily hydrolase (TIGR01509 family)